MKTMQKKSNQPEVLRWLCSAILLLGILSYSSIVQAVTQAGTVISNMAVGEYQQEGSTVVQVSRSNLVTTTIIPVYAFSLTADQQIQVVQGQEVSFHHTLTNTGNSTDRYDITLQNLGGDDYDYSNLRIYIDANHDGIPDGNPISSYSLGMGESVDVIIRAVVPVGATTGSGLLSLSVTSQADNTTLSNTDEGVLTDQSVVTVRKSFSQTDVQNGDIVTVRLEYENSGSISSGQISLLDSLTSELTYVAGNENWNGQALDPASGANDPAGIDYYVSGQDVHAILTSIPAHTSGYIEFRVQVTQSFAGSISNRISYDYDHDSNAATANIQNLSNIAKINIIKQYGVEINAISTTPSNASVDNLVVAPAGAPGEEIRWTNYVWNTGNTPDRFNLSFDSTTFPTPHQVEFYRADGITPLLDSNNDGVPDTGVLQPGESLQIVVKLRLPTTHADTTTTDYDLFPKATSIGDTSQTDTVDNRASIIVTDQARLVDLMNRPETTNNGESNGAVDNTGQAWKTLAGNTGETVFFPLLVQHTGTTTRYTLSADADGDFNTPDLPAGVESVHFYHSSNGTDCTVLGAEIGETRLLNDGETQLYCAAVKLKTIANSSIEPIWFRVASATYVSANNTGNPGLDTLKNAIEITSLNNQGVVSLSPDQHGQVAVGGTVVYSHMLHNATTTSLSGDHSLSILNSNSDFSTTLYYDANNDGVLDGSDPVITDLSILPGGALAAKQSIRLFAKVEHVGSGGLGVVDTTKIELRDASNTLITNATDTTTISETQIRLTKLQAKDADCDGAPETAYSTSDLMIGRNNDGSAQCVRYRLIVQNQGSDAIGSFNFRDATPPATVMSSQPQCVDCTSTSAPANGQSGTLVGTLPSLSSNSSSIFEFGVKYEGQ